MSDHGSIYVVVNPVLSDRDVPRVVAMGMHLMDCEAMNAMASGADQEFVTVFADGTDNLRAIVCEAVIRRDWVVAVAGDDQDEPLCAVIGPTTGAGPLLLDAEGATSSEARG